MSSANKGMRMLSRAMSWIGARATDRRAAEEAALITQSGLFDERWYQATYPDVVGYPGGSLSHYLKYGGSEGRAPGPRFDPRSYLIANPDVAEPGTNLLLHYLREGKREGHALPPIAYDAEAMGSHGDLDVFDPHAVAEGVGLPLAKVVWSSEDLRQPDDLSSAARIVLELLRRYRHLQPRSPTALRDGPGGAFALWAKQKGLAQLGFDASAADWIDAAFAARIDRAARETLYADVAFRQARPLFLLPSCALPTSRRLFKDVYERSLSLESVWWFLLANAEDTQAALCETWAITPEWQAAVPDGGTVFGVVRLAEWVAETYQCRDAGIFAQTFPRLLGDAEQLRLAYAARPEWQALFPKATQDREEAAAFLEHLGDTRSDLHFLPRAWLAERQPRDLAGDLTHPGLNILGHFTYPSGLRTSAEHLVEGLTRQGIATALRDVPVIRNAKETFARDFHDMEVFDTTLIHVQPEPLFDRAYEIAGLLPRQPRTYRIGYWYWEFDEIPPSWNRVALQCDEFWTATEFIATGLRKRYRQPVHVLTPGAEIAPFEKTPRTAFGVRDDEFVFLFVFHMTSVMDRKNPLGLIAAFRRAFPEGGGSRLIIKTAFGDQHPAELDRLRAAANGAAITIIDRVSSRDETLSLMACADAYVSLHRSEGLGLTMAEAMLLGCPVVATRFSGNLDFMNDENSLLVDCDPVTIEKDIAPYRAGQVWAEPHIHHAAQLMRKLYDDPEWGRTLGARAKIDLEHRLCSNVTGQKMAQRLAEIAAERRNKFIPD
ncbi:glycosyltransferase family 4 protein [Methylobacterium komagatae]